MMSCIMDALTAGGYSQTGADTGYISEINGIEEKAAAKGSGWMGTLNDWFTSEGFANYTVANGKLKAGDEIAVQHTCNLGADIGGAFGDSNKTLKAIALSAGELTPAFSSDNHAYTMILPDGTDSLTVTPTASNKQNRVRIYVGGTEYGRKDAIPVQVGTVITLKVGNDGDAAPETYTIALQAAGTFLSGENVALTTVKQNGDAGNAVALTFDKKTAAFTGKLANYTHLKEYNDGGFTVTLSDLPAGATAQLKSIDGKSVSTDTLSNNGKPFIIDFFATWCKPCNRELTAISEVYEEWQEETGVKVIAVSIDQAQNINKVKPLVDNHGWQYEVLLDPNSDFKRALGIQTIPYVIVCDGNGKIVSKHNGYTEGAEEELIEEVRKLVNK